MASSGSARPYSSSPKRTIARPSSSTSATKWSSRGRLSSRSGTESHGSVSVGVVTIRDSAGKTEPDVAVELEPVDGEAAADRVDRRLVGPALHRQRPERESEPPVDGELVRRLRLLGRQPVVGEDDVPVRHRDVADELSLVGASREAERERERVGAPPAHVEERQGRVALVRICGTSSTTGLVYSGSVVCSGVPSMRTSRRCPGSASAAAPVRGPTISSSTR